MTATRLKLEGEPLRPEDWTALGRKVPEGPLGPAEGLFVSAIVNGELQRYGVYVGLSPSLEPELRRALALSPRFGSRLWRP